MAAETPWDVRVVNLASDSLTVVSHVPNWHSLQFGDMLNSPGHGSLEVDFDETWLSDFQSANSAYPWEGNYGLQVLRSGQLVFTFIIEEAEIEYAGARRRVVMGGRGLIACLQWAVVLPDGWDESASDPDGLVNYVNRGFGNSHSTTAELDAGTYSVDSPKYKAYGGAAFVYLFNEADTGNTQTWQETVAGATADIATGAASRNGSGVSWPLSLKSGMSVTTDSAGTAWNATGTYPAADVTWLFEIQSGQNMLDALGQCAELQAQAQWMVSPSGEISVAKSVGVDKTGTILLTVPNAVRSANAFRRTDLRSHMIGSNGWVFEHETNSAAVTTYGRREGFVGHDNAHGQGNVEATKAALNDVKDPLDEFTFQYVETDTTQAWLDFAVGDKVRIEYKPGTVQDRQVVGLSASLSPSSSAVEVTIGDVVSNVIARLEKKESSEQYSDQINQKNVTSSAKPNPPTNLTVVSDKEGLSRRATLSFDQPAGWENEIAHYEAEVYNAAATGQKYRLSRPVQRGSTGQTMEVNGFGTKGGTYKANVRSISKAGHVSDPSTEATFVMTASGEGTSSDPDRPSQITGLSLFGMLNAILVKFNDLNAGSNVTMSGNRGKYEIQVSNATGGSANWASGNTWTRTVGGQTSGDSSSAARQAFVPTGDGFIIPGLLSQSGGRTHYVRARAINWDGTEGDWSSTVSVSLDTDDESQTGVWIGEDTIHASHIRAGTITSTEILAGTITASDINAGEVITSSIVMPQPAGASNAGEMPSARTFTIDHSGNMWWGDHTSFTAAVTGNDNPRFKADGTDFFVGGSTNSLHWDGSELEIKGKLTAGQISINSGRFQVDTSGNVIAKSVTLGDANYGTSVVMGGSGKVRLRVATSDYGSWTTTTALEWLSSNLSTTYGSVVGGAMSISGSSGGLRMQSGAGTGSTYVEVRNPPSAGGAGEGIRVAATTTNADKITVWAGGTLSLDGSTIYLGTSSGGSQVQVPRNGIEFVTNTPAVVTNKLYNASGTLYWSGDPVSVGGSYSWDLSANYASTSSSVTVNDGDRVDFTNVGSAGIAVTRPAGTTIRTALDFGNMDWIGSSVLIGTDRIAVYDASAGAHKYATVQEVLDAGTGSSYSWDLSANYASTSSSVTVNDGDRVDFTNVGSAGIAVTRPAGNTIRTALDIGNMDWIGSSVLVGTDRIAVYDASGLTHKYATVQDVLDAGTSSGYSWNAKASGGTSTEITDGETIDFTKISNAGLNVVRVGNAIRTELDINNMTAVTPQTTDKLAIYDGSLSAHRSITVQDILDLGGGGDVTYVGAVSSGGLKSTNPGGPTPTLALDVFDNLSTTTPATDDWVPIYDGSALTHKRVTISDLVACAGLPLSGGTLSGSLYFSNGNWVQGSTGGGMVLTGGSNQSGWLRGNGGLTTGGVESTGSLVKFYHGTASVCTTFAGGLHATAGQFAVGSGTTDKVAVVSGGGISLLASNTVMVAATTAHTYISNPSVTSVMCNNRYGFTTDGSTTRIKGGASSTTKISTNGTNLYVYPSVTSATYYMGMTSSWEMTYFSSAERYKERVTTVTGSDALTRISALRPVDFYWKGDTISGTSPMTAFDKRRGFIAEEVADIDHTYGGWGWYSPDDEYALLGPNDPENEVPDEDYYDLEEAVPTNWNYEAIIADLVAVVQSLESRLAVLET